MTHHCDPWVFMLSFRTHIWNNITAAEYKLRRREPVYNGRELLLCCRPTHVHFLIHLQSCYLACTCLSLCLSIYLELFYQPEELHNLWKTLCVFFYTVVFWLSLNDGPRCSTLRSIIVSYGTAAFGLDTCRIMHEMNTVQTECLVQSWKRSGIKH